MYSRGLRCIDCHGDMDQVASPSRRPWIDEPRYEPADCHGSQSAEEPGKRYRNSRGHGGLSCPACHDSPHAIWPSLEANDNIQTIALQGHAGTLDDCRVCHNRIPAGAGPHGIVIVRPTATSTATPSPTPIGRIDAEGLLAMLGMIHQTAGPDRLLFEAAEHWME